MTRFEIQTLNSLCSIIYAQRLLSKSEHTEKQVEVLMELNRELVVDIVVNLVVRLVVRFVVGKVVGEVVGEVFTGKVLVTTIAPFLMLA